jgi:hypothetical protein
MDYISLYIINASVYMEKLKKVGRIARTSESLAKSADFLEEILEAPRSRCRMAISMPQPPG